MLSRSTALSPREWEVAELLAEGLQQTEVADRLVVSRFTVQSHVRHMRQKTGARNSVQLMYRIMLPQRTSCG